MDCYGYRNEEPVQLGRWLNQLYEFSVSANDCLIWRFHVIQPSFGSVA